MLHSPRPDFAQPVAQAAAADWPPPPTGPWGQVLRQVLPVGTPPGTLLPARAVGAALLLLAAAPLAVALVWGLATGVRGLVPGLLAAGWLAWVASVAWWLRRRQRSATALPAPSPWLAAAAHALRNRLSALGGAAEVLGTPAATPAVRERARNIAAQQLRQLASLAANLAELAESSDGAAGRLDGTPQDLAALALAALDAQRPTARAGGQLLLHATQPTPVLGEARALEQAVAALLCHALRQLPTGAGLVLEVRAEPPLARLTLRSDRPGPARAASRPPPPPDDPDLGLALAHCTVARHGGRLTVAGGAEPAVGLWLPLQPGCAAGVPARPPARPAAALRVVLVEDVAGVRDSVAAQLREDGHAVSALADGEAGLRSLLAEWPDAAVIDLSLPGMTGCALARTARRAGYAGRMVAIAGYEPSLERGEALQAGFDACLHKPVRTSQLRQALAGHG